MVCCPCCGPKKVLSSFSFKCHSFTHRVHVFIGAYSKCNQDERGGIRTFYSFLHLLAVKRNSAGSLAILDHVANQIMPQCKLHVSALMLMSRTSKTLITDRGPPTFGDGTFPKQVISSVALICVLYCHVDQSMCAYHSDLCTHHATKTYWFHLKADRILDEDERLKPRSCCCGCLSGL